MTKTSQGGIAIAKKIASVYRCNPNVQVMILGGSVARQWADPYSDLELGVFWNSPPTDEERTTLIRQAGGDLWTFHSHPPYSTWIASEHWGLERIEIDSRTYAGTSMIDVKHMTVTNLEQCIQDVIEELDTALDKQVVLSAIVDGISLIGDEALQNWQLQARSFPTPLAVKIVQENLWFGPWFPALGYIERNDVLVTHQHFIWAGQSMLRVLAALNRVYYPSSEHKWMTRLANELQFAPPNLAERLQEVFTLDLAGGWKSLRTLLDETIQLVEEHLPEVNSMALFKDHPEINTDWAKNRWEPNPPYTLMASIGS
ncbi:MAG: nucleotidyltransferase domain-containing protein [Chloroflexota bacterium]